MAPTQQSPTTSKAASNFAVERSAGLWQVLRWIAFIPGGLIGGFICAIAAGLFAGVGAWLMGATFVCPYTILLAGGVEGYATVVIASRIAPCTVKTAPATAIGTILILVGVVGVLLYFLVGEWLRLAQGVVWILATVVAMHQEMTDNQPEGVGVSV